jgi:hypothetical protein
MAIPLGRPLPAASSDQPGREPRDGPGGVAAPLAPIRSCSRWGLPCRGRYRPRGALLPHPFTLAGGLAAARRFAFCGAFPEVTLAGRYPAPCLHGARTFLCFRSGHPAGWRERLRSLDEAGQPPCERAGLTSLLRTGLSDSPGWPCACRHPRHGKPAPDTSYRSAGSSPAPTTPTVSRKSPCRAPSAA